MSPELAQGGVDASESCFCQRGTPGDTPQVAVCMPSLASEGAGFQDCYGSENTQASCVWQ